MVMVPLSKVFAPTAIPGGGIEAHMYGVQVYPRSTKMDWVVKPIIIRKPPITALLPTPRQAEMRLAVIEKSSAWKGKRGRATLKYDSRSGKHKAGDRVLAVQAAFQEAIRGISLTKPRAATYDPATGRYRTYIRYRLHTKEELRKFMGEEVTAPTPPVTGIPAGARYPVF